MERLKSEGVSLWSAGLDKSAGECYARVVRTYRAYRGRKKWLRGYV